MINTTRSFRSSLLACVFCGASAASLLAQAPADQPPGGDHHHGSPSVLFDVLDANHDGILSAEEIANASTVLKGLLKDGQTQLTRGDLRPEHKDGRLAHQPSDNDQEADDRPREHRRSAMDNQETPSPWKHHFRHDAEGQRWERPAQAQHEDRRAEDHPRPDFDQEAQSDQPRHPHFEHPRDIERQADERDEAGTVREMDQVLGALHRLEREVRELKEAQETPTPAAH